MDELTAVGPPPPSVVVPLAPAPVPQSAPGGGLPRLIPVATLVVTAGMVALVFAVGSPLLNNPMFLAFPVMMALSALASLANGAGRRSAAELDGVRRRYLGYLGDIALRLTESGVAQRVWLNQRHPAPERLWLLAGTDRRWGRDRDDDQFCRIRFGTGQVVAAAQPQPPAAVEGPADDADPVTTLTLARLVDAYAMIDDAPLTVDLCEVPVLRLTVRVTEAEQGRSDDARDLARALICQLATFHSPADVVIAAVVGDHTRRHWDWLKWLPHHEHPELVDSIGPARLTHRTLGAALASAPPGRHVVVLVDGVEIDTAGLAAGVTAICIGGSAVSGEGTLEIADGVVTLSAGGDRTVARPDAMSPLAAATCARRLTQRRLTGEHRVSRDWPSLLGVAAPHLRDDLISLWHSPVQLTLRVPLGVTEQGEPVHLDVKEAALGGMGPHGLCVGATGSGKSELLRTIALGMIARHSPDELNLILVDFKGGATFLEFGRSAHVAAVITNLADEAHLVERMQDALGGEIHRRQQALRNAGNLSGVAAYGQARRARPDLPALPALFIIVDEFTELLTRHPDFIDAFIAIGRLGRSLGIHLLLASQRLDESRLRGLDSHLSYRICLKTLSPQESRAAIGVPDAYQLPIAPGAAYLKVGADEPTRFQAAHVSGPAPQVGTATRDQLLDKPVVFTAAPVGELRALQADTPNKPTADRPLLDVVLDAVDGHGPPAHRVWLPPLTSSPTLDAMLPGTGRAHGLTVPIGLSDRAFEQRLAPVLLELAGAAGNVAVVGAPQSGKSTALRTLALGLCATHHPDEVQLYCLDFGGGGLSALAGLPHVGVVAGRQEPELVRRTVAQIAARVRRREKHFVRLGANSMAEYRRHRGDGDHDSADVFLVVDGWAALRQEFDALEAQITTLAAEGLSFGVHVVLGASRWAEIRPALKDQIATRIELRLGDPADSEIDRKRAASVPRDRPGHGLAPDGLPLVIALPRLDGHATADGLAAAGQAATELVAARHDGRRAPAVLVLPEHVDYHDLLSGSAQPPTHPLLGLGGDEFVLLTADVTQDPVLVISGDPGSGKTAALRLIIREISRTALPDGARCYLVDPRRTLIDEMETGTVAGYATTPDQVATSMAAAAALLRGRLPDAGTSPRQLRTRSWWTGPEVYLLVDDYDLICGGNPLGPIADLLPHARDIGLRVVVARRSAGAARALYDPVLSALRELGAVGVQLSHSGDDAPLLGSSRPGRSTGVLPPGRAVLISRAGEQLMQLAWVPPA